MLLNHSPKQLGRAPFPPGLGWPSIHLPELGSHPITTMSCSAPKALFLSANKADIVLVEIRARIELKAIPFPGPTSFHFGGESLQIHNHCIRRSASRKMRKSWTCEFVRRVDPLKVNFNSTTRPIHNDQIICYYTIFHVLVNQVLSRLVNQSFSHYRVHSVIAAQYAHLEISPICA